MARHDARVQRVMTSAGVRLVVRCSCGAAPRGDWWPRDRRDAVAARDRHVAAHTPPPVALQPALPGLETGTGVA